jgi:hypothetical protein
MQVVVVVVEKVVLVKMDQEIILLEPNVLVMVVLDITLVLMELHLGMLVVVVEEIKEMEYKELAAVA